MRWQNNLAWNELIIVYSAPQKETILGTEHISWRSLRTEHTCTTHYTSAYCTGLLWALNYTWSAQHVNHWVYNTHGCVLTEYMLHVPHTIRIVLRQCSIYTAHNRMCIHSRASIASTWSAHQHIGGVLRVVLTLRHTWESLEGKMLHLYNLRECLTLCTL